MKRRYLTIAIGLSCFGHPVSAKENLSLKDFLDAATSANETRKINAAQAEQFSAKKEQSLATMMPQVKAIGTYARQDNSGSPTIDANSSSAKLNLTQPLLGIYKNRSAVEYVEQQLDGVVLSGDDSILQLKIALSDAFHAVLIAKSDVKDYIEIQAIAQKRVKETQTRVKIGKSRVADLYSAQAQLATVDSQLEQARATESNARILLAQLSGLPADTEISDSVNLPAKQLALDSFLGATDSLPSIRSLGSLKKSADLQVEVARNQRIPDLDLFANYYLHRDTPLDKVRWDIGLQMTWSIYDGGLIPAKVREAQVQGQMYDYQLMQKRRITELKIRQYYEQYVASLRQMPILETSVALAKKSYESIEKDYKLGLTTILDLIQSFNAVADARRQQNHQMINAKATLADLQLNAGQKL